MVIAAAGTVPKAKMAICHPPGRFAADGFAIEDLATVGCCSHAAAVLGPPVVVHELIAVTTHPRLTIVGSPPQNPRMNAPQMPSKKATRAIPHSNFCQLLAMDLPLREQEPSKGFWIPLYVDGHWMAVQG
jgi:hypothetical protein